MTATEGQPKFRQSVAVVIGINGYSHGITRPLTCEEQRDFLHETVPCAVATPIPVAN